MLRSFSNGWVWAEEICYIFIRTVDVWFMSALSSFYRFLSGALLGLYAMKTGSRVLLMTVVLNFRSFCFLERCIAVVWVGIKLIQDSVSGSKIVSQVSMGMKVISVFLENTKIFIPRIQHPLITLTLPPVHPRPPTSFSYRSNNHCMTDRWLCSFNIVSVIFNSKKFFASGCL